MITANTINSIINDFNTHIRYAYEYQEGMKPLAPCHYDEVFEGMKPLASCYHDGVLDGMIMVLSELGAVDPDAKALAGTLWDIRADRERADRERADRERADMEQAQKELLS